MSLITSDAFARHVFDILSKEAQDFYAENLTGEDSIHDLDLTLEGNTITVTTRETLSEETQRFTIIIRG